MKKKLLTTASTLAVGLSLMITSNVSATAPEFKRLCGNDRYQTCSAIVNEGWNCSEYAVIVNGENFPDALSASTLAKKYNAPILLTENNQLNSNTYKQLKRLNVNQVFIVGGDSVVKPDVENTINGLGIKTTRYKGMNRTETSIAVAKQIGVQNGVILTTGNNFTDALSVAPIAAKLQIPIILMQKDSIPDSVSNFIADKNISNTYVLGGKDLISDYVASKFPNVRRIEGSDKYERNINIINVFANEFNFNGAYLANSEKFADALSGSALAALNGNPIILIGDTPATVTKNFISSKKLSNLNVLGGTGVVKDDTINKIENSFAKDTSVISTTNSSKVVTFADKNLEKVIRELIEKPTGDILKSDAEKVTNIGAQKQNITNLSGIENFTNLTSIYLDWNQISDIEPLRGLTKLTDLGLVDNPISSVEPLRGLTKLTNLYLGGNSFNDIEPLKGLTNLQTLRLGQSQISNIEVLKGFTELKKLYLRDIPIRNIEPLRELTNLTELDLFKTQVSDIESLRRLTNLTKLELDGNPITNVDALRGLNNLTILNISHSPISNIEPLKGLTNLKSICLFNNEITSIESLEGLTNLKSLRMSNNKITSIEPLRGLTGLRDLWLSGNQITDYSPVSSYYNSLQYPDFTLS